MGRTIDFEERVPAEGVPLGPVLHRGEAHLKALAFAFALALHATALVLRFPAAAPQLAPPPPPANAVVVRKYVPPPPRMAEPRRRTVEAAGTRAFTRQLPVPDPSPDEPEPVRESEGIAREIGAGPPPADIEFLIGVPEAPALPRTAPLIAGVGGVTLPERIADSYVEPTYPELARLARLEGQVILQAVILADGTVGEVVVLRCTRPHVGFEEAAVEAVRHWRYEPAMQGARAVSVIFTVLVDFDLS